MCVKYVMCRREYFGSGQCFAEIARVKCMKCRRNYDWNRFGITFFGRLCISSERNIGKDVMRGMDFIA